MGRFRESIASRHADSDALVDPECYDTPMQALGEKFSRALFTIGIALGLA